MKKDILQTFINENRNCLIGNRYIEGFGAARGKDEWQAILLAPDVDREYWTDDIGKLSYDLVDKFANEEIKTIIHLGDTYSPFQYGIRRKDFISVQKVTCRPMDLVVHCHKEKITDYYKVLEAMELLNKKVD